MYRNVITLALAFLLNACASPQQQAQVAEFKNWQASRQAQARAGQVQWSMYYSELWSRMSNLPNDPQKPLMMATTAELIPCPLYTSDADDEYRVGTLGRFLFTATNKT